jgi:hypothetical protein
MKLRIRGNSIRLRLLRGEAAELGAIGKVSETINFGAQKLIYTVRASRETTNIAAHFAENEIIILLPDKLAREWVESNEISLTAEQKITQTETLKILVEKDFVCLDRPDDADNRDAFPHPAKKC